MSTTTPSEEMEQATAVRQVKLSVTRINPLSVLKISFLIAVAIGIATIVAVAIVWVILDIMHVWADLNEFVTSVDSGSMTALMAYTRLPRVLAATTVVAVFNVVLISALSIIGAFIYNLTVALVGGVQLDLTDE